MKKKKSFKKYYNTVDLILNLEELQKLFFPRPNKILLFLEMRVKRKTSPGQPQFFFNLIFFNLRDTLFSSLVSLAFLYSCFCFCSFVCFLKLKIYILIHVGLCGRVSDKNFFTRPISGNKTTFFGPTY